MEALKSVRSIAANHKLTFLSMHIDVSRAYFHAKKKSSETCAGPVSRGEQKGCRRWKFWIVEKRVCMAQGDAVSKWERDWQHHLKRWGYQLGLSSKSLFRQEGHQFSGMTHGDDFVLTGPTDRLADLKNKNCGGVSNQNPKNHQSRVNREHQSTKQEFALDKRQEWCINTMPDMLTCL